MTERRRRLAAAAEAAAKELHEAGASVVACIVFDSVEDSTIVGGWVPDTETLVLLLERVIRSVNGGDAHVVDRTKVGG